MCGAEDRLADDVSTRKLPSRVEDCSHPGKTDALRSCAKEDRRCTEGAMGKGQGGEEDSLILRCTSLSARDTYLTFHQANLPR